MANFTAHHHRCSPEFRFFTPERQGLIIVIQAHQGPRIRHPGNQSESTLLFVAITYRPCEGPVMVSVDKDKMGTHSDQFHATGPSAHLNC
jgi:hypothetical protein